MQNIVNISWISLQTNEEARDIKYILQPFLYPVKKQTVNYFQCFLHCLPIEAWVKEV